MVHALSRQKGTYSSLSALDTHFSPGGLAVKALEAIIHGCAPRHWRQRALCARLAPYKWVLLAGDDESAHLLGARLAATPAADKVDRRGAHADASDVCIVVICQLVGQAAPLWLLARSLHTQPCSSCVSRPIARISAQQVSAQVRSMLLPSPSFGKHSSNVARGGLCGADRLVSESRIAGANLIADTAIQGHEAVTHHHPPVRIALQDLLRCHACTSM